VEIFATWQPWFADVNKLIDEAEIIQGFPFVKLEYVLDWKRKFAREKDLVHVKLIEEYLAK